MISTSQSGLLGLGVYSPQSCGSLPCTAVHRGRGASPVIKGGCGCSGLSGMGAGQFEDMIKAGEQASEQSAGYIPPNIGTTIPHIFYDWNTGGLVTETASTSTAPGRIPSPTFSATGYGIPSWAWILGIAGLVALMASRD